MLYLYKITLALDNINTVLEMGEKRYPNDLWKTQSINFHLWRCLKHLFKWYFKINYDEDHLGHALTRLSFAVQLVKEQKSTKDCNTRDTTSLS
jgi:hypothetical protein